MRMERQVLAELHQLKEPSGARSLVVYDGGQAQASGAVPGGEQTFLLPRPTLQRVQTQVASIPWQEVPEAIGDLTLRDDVLRAGGREVHVGIGGGMPVGVAGALMELGWILLAVVYPDLLHAMRSGQFSGDPRWMNLRIGHEGAVYLGTIKGSATGRLEADELGHLRGILEGMRFTELDVRDSGYFDWELVHGFNRVVLESDTMDRAFVPLLQLCGEIELRLLREMPPPPAGA